MTISKDNLSPYKPIQNIKYFLLAFLLSSCITPNFLLSPTSTPTPEPTLTPTPYFNTLSGPLGSEANPIVFGYVHPPDEDSALNLSQELSSQTGYSFAINQYQSPIDLLHEMQSGLVQFAWITPIAYIYAHEHQFAEILLISNHYGVYGYGAQFLANQASGFSAYFDENLNQVTGDAKDALAQMEGKTACFLSENSPSGYIVPVGLLQENQINFQTAAIMQGHTAVIRALYIKDICDFGVTFTYSGDPRTSPSLQDIPDVRDKIQIIWRTDPIIPSDGLAVKPEIPDEMRDVIKNVFLSMAKTEDGKALLGNALDYDVQNLIEAQDNAYDPLRDLIIASQVNLENILSK